MNGINWPGTVVAGPALAQTFEGGPSVSQGICSVAECERPSRARGWCKRHWARWRATGDPLLVRVATPRKPSPPEPRFWGMVDRSGGSYACWPWLGYVNREGYGSFTVNGRPCGAHRISYRISRGPTAKGLVIDHLCRNRSCVNPAHLELVTPAVNTLRGVGPSAAFSRATACVNGHEFTAANTRIQRDTRNPGARVCITCARDAVRRYRARRAAA